MYYLPDFFHLYNSNAFYCANFLHNFVQINLFCLLLPLTESFVAPHPKAGEAGWRYGSGKKIRLSGYWSYYDRMKGKYRSTKGIAAQMPVLKAALEMRAREAEKGREAMK